jgi:protein tyrosine phosphatase
MITGPTDKTHIASVEDNKVNVNKDQQIGWLDYIIDCFKNIAHFFTCGVFHDKSFSDRNIIQIPRSIFTPFDSKEIKQNFQVLAANTKLIDVERCEYNDRIDRTRHPIVKKTLVPTGNENGRYGFNANQLNINEVQSIATQYPLDKEGMRLFWKMCAAQGSCIVDLPNDKKSVTQRNMPPYYPPLGKTMHFKDKKEDILVMCIGNNELDNTDIQQSIYTININGHYGKITRLHLQSWPEHSAANVSQVIKLVNNIRALPVVENHHPIIQGENHHPIIHCYSGFGKTAVVSTLLTLIDPLLSGAITHDNLLFELNDTILKGREQRSNHFIENEEQYTLLVRICEEILKNPRIIASPKRD